MIFGFGSLAAHAHADALSVELRHDGVEVLCDPGTYSYHGEPRWPDLVVFLGDQVYADETTEPMHEFIAAKRDITEPPGEVTRSTTSS